MKHALKTVKASFAGVSALGEKTTYLHCSIMEEIRTPALFHRKDVPPGAGCAARQTPHGSVPLVTRFPNGCRSKGLSQPALTPRLCGSRWPDRYPPPPAGEGKGEGQEGDALPGAAPAEGSAAAGLAGAAGGQQRKGQRCRAARRGRGGGRAARGGGGERPGAARRSAPRGEGARRVRGLGAVSVTLPWGRRGLVPACPGEGKGHPSPSLPSPALLRQSGS